MAPFFQTLLRPLQVWVETDSLVEVLVRLFGLAKVLVDNTPVEVGRDVRN